MANILSGIENLGDMGKDAVLSVLETAIDAVGEGMEWTGDELAKLGELAEKLSAKVDALKGGGATA